MKLAGIILCAFLLQDAIPYKPSDHFVIRLDYQLKVKPVDNSRSYEKLIQRLPGIATREQANDSPLPFLNVNVEILKLAEEEVKVRVSDNKDNMLYTRRVAAGAVFRVPFGYMDDVKGDVSPSVYTLTFLTKEKKNLSRIVFFIDANGTFFVNGEKQGEFQVVNKC